MVEGQWNIVWDNPHEAAVLLKRTDWKPDRRVLVPSFFFARRVLELLKVPQETIERNIKNAISGLIH